MSAKEKIVEVLHEIGVTPEVIESRIEELIKPMEELEALLFWVVADPTEWINHIDGEEFRQELKRQINEKLGRAK